jgi:hypothetical protein
MFSWNWAATESASVVEEAVTIAVVSRARPLTTAFIVTVAPDTMTIRNLHVIDADLSDGIDRAFEQPNDDEEDACARTWQCGRPGGRPHKTGTPASEEAGVPSNDSASQLTLSK